MKDPTFPLTKLAFLAFQVNSIIDNRNMPLSIKALKDHADAGTVFELLESAKVDTSIYDVGERAFLSARFTDMLGIQEGRKFGVEANGWCLLIAYLLEIMQVTRARAE
jgi:hypothetical protein